MIMDRTWIEGQPSAYQQHDTVHFPDWKNIIVWDLFFNNLTAGFMFVTMITWLTAPALFGPVMPIALTLAFFIVLFDLLLLVADLGDHVRFLHAMRVLHPTSPLSVGVVGLIFYSIMLFIALAIYWVTVALLATIGLPPEVVVVLDVLFRLFAVLALIAACVVICYKGVVFSCTSQPGLKKARWLTCWVASDALTMGMGLLIVLSLVFGQIAAVEALIIPFIALIVFRCFTYALVSTNAPPRCTLRRFSRAMRSLSMASQASAPSLPASSGRSVRLPLECSASLQVSGNATGSSMWLTRIDAIPQATICFSVRVV